MATSDGPCHCHHTTPTSVRFYPPATLITSVRFYPAYPSATWELTSLWGSPINSVLGMFLAG